MKLVCLAWDEPGVAAAVRDLERLLRRRSGADWGVSTALPERGKCIVAGCWPRAGLLRELLAGSDAAEDVAWTGADGFVIVPVRRGELQVLVVASGSAAGLTAGLYRIAELAGERFYLSRSAYAPGALAAALRDQATPWPELRCAERPRFGGRGALPWFNFLSGPSAWDAEDWADYVDNLARARANWLGVHVYTGGLERYATYVEPLVRYEVDGVLPQAELDTTATARWGYRPLATRRFLAGSDRLYAADPFGSEAARGCHTPAERYARAQSLLAGAFARAHRRGLSTFLGIEAGIVPPELHSILPPSARLATGELNPCDPAAIRLFERMLAQALRTYPDLSAIWLFQHEHTMFSGQVVPEGRFGEYCRSRAGAFGALPPERAWSGPWFLAWAELTFAWLQKHAPGVELMLSGWGGATQFRSLLGGLDALLPSAIGVAMLLPDLGASPAPPELLALSQRKRFLVPWWEGDHQLWHPQPRVGALLEQLETAVAHAFDGVIGLHWRTRDVEENAWAFFDAAWERRAQPLASTASVYADFAQHAWGATDGAAAGALWQRIESEQLLAGAASPEFYPYHSSWGRLQPERRARLQAVLAELEALLPAAVEAGVASADPEYAPATLRFVLALDDWSRALAAAEAAAARQADAQAMAALDRAPVQAAIAALMARVRTKGDLGLLASVNQRLGLAHSDWLARLGTAVRSAGDAAAGAAEATRVGAPAQVALAEPGVARQPALGQVPDVVLPVRSLAAKDETLHWRVLVGRDDCGAVLLQVTNRAGQSVRRPLEREGPHAFGCRIALADLGIELDGPLRFWVETITYGGRARPLGVAHALALEEVRGRS